MLASREQTFRITLSLSNFPQPESATIFLLVQGVRRFDDTTRPYPMMSEGSRRRLECFPGTIR